MIRSLKLGAFAAATLIACAPALAAGQAAAPVKQAAANPQAGKQLNKLADEYYDALARFDPVAASESGDNRFIDQIGMSISPSERSKQFARYKAFQKRLHAIKRAQLNSRDQTSYDILDYELGMALRFEPFPEHLLPLNQMDSMPVTLANYSSGQGAQPLATLQDYRAYASRLAQLGPWVDQAIANMREGIKRGIVHPKSVMLSALPQFKQLVAGAPEESIYYTPVKHFPDGFSDADKRALVKLYGETIGMKLNPALARLADFIEKDYLPATRTSSPFPRGHPTPPGGGAPHQRRTVPQPVHDHRGGEAECDVTHLGPRIALLQSEIHTDADERGEQRMGERRHDQPHRGGDP